MRSVGRISLVAFALVVITGATPNGPMKKTVLIRSSDVTLHVEPDTTIGQLYTVSYSLPDELVAERLERALLEVFVDVRSKVRDGYTNEAPVLEVYALAEPFGDRFERKKLDPKTRAVRPVALGAGRRVVLDITGIIRSQLSGELGNYGLVIGSVSGMREGEFGLVAGRLPEGAVGQIRYYQSMQAVGE